jgi:VWFA-related protein
MPPGKLIVWACAATCCAQTVLFRSDVAQVRVHASVYDGERVVDGLGRSDFRILDNNSPRSLLHVSQDEEPLDMILLFDVSGSMRPNVERVAQSARVALAELQSGDRVGIMVFSRSARMILPLTADLEAVERSVFEDVLSLDFGGGTRILSSVDDAARYLIGEPRDQRRRAILVITDNLGSRSRRESTVINRMWEADAVLSGLIVQRGMDRLLRWSMRLHAPHMTLLEEGIDGVCEKTGGDMIRADVPEDAFRDMMSRIRRRYSLYYALPEGAPGELRRVQVSLSEEARLRYPKAQIRARTGYRLPGDN